MKLNVIRNSSGKFVSVPVGPNTTDRTCSSCKKTKDLSLFGNHKTGILGKKGRCKKCDSDASSRYNKRNPEKTRRHRRALTVRRKGLTLADYDAMLEAQGHACAMCGTEESGGRGHFPIDHCHRTDTVRGILCNNCNLLLGHANDDITLLEKAIAYLTRTATR